MALDYEDLNDHDTLRADSLLLPLVGKRDVTGEHRERARDEGYPLAGSSTPKPPQAEPPRLGSRVLLQEDRRRSECSGPVVLVDLFLGSHERPPRYIWLDLNATGDPLHGQRGGRFFYGYYGCYCYLPRYIFCGEHFLCARLRPSNADGAPGCVEELEQIVGQLRARWPKTRTKIRGDSGFCRDAIMSWCEKNRVGYVLALARSKEQQLGLSADRTRTATIRANQLRSSFAYVLLQGLWRLGVERTRHAKVKCMTIRLKWLKIGARIRIRALNVWQSFSEAYPDASDIAQILANLRRDLAWAVPG